MPKVITISFVVAIAEVYKNEGNDEYNKNNFNSAIFFYTEGIKVNCKDEDLNAKLYSNRAAAHFNLGKKLLYIRELKQQRSRQPEVAFFHFLTVVSRKFSVKSPP